MNNSSNIWLVVIDGTQDIVNIKGHFQMSNPIIKFDLTGEITSEITIFDAESVAEELDLITFQFNGMQHNGRIKQVTREKGKSKLECWLGQDVFQFDVPMPGNKLQPIDITETQFQALELSIISDDYVSTSDYDLALDVLCRQAMRRSPKKLVMDWADSKEEKLKIKITDNPTDYELNEISLEYQPFVSDLKVTFATDQFNYLRLKNQDDTSQYKDFFLLSDGSVSETREPGVKLIQKVEKVESDKWNDLSYATSKIKAQEYNNEIEFKYPLYLSDLQGNALLEYNETFLGRKLICYLSGFDNPITTIISGVIIDKNVMSITLGLSRRRYSRQKKKEE